MNSAKSPHYYVLNESLSMALAYDISALKQGCFVSFGISDQVYGSTITALFLPIMVNGTQQFAQ